MLLFALILKNIFFKSSRFSEHVGFPISKGKTDKMYVIEYHYDNPLKSASKK